MERNLNFRQNVEVGFWENPRRTLRGVALGTGMYTGGIYAAAIGEIRGAILVGAIGTAVNIATVTYCYSRGRIIRERLRRRDG